MPRYAESVEDYGYFELVRLNGEMYGVLEDEPEDIVRLVPLEAVRKHGDDPDALKEASILVPISQMQLVDPVKPSLESARSLFRLEAMPWDLLEQGQFPFSSATGRIDIGEEDILCMIGHISLFRNVFVWRNWSLGFIQSYETGKPIHIRLPEADRPGFSFRFFADRFFDLIDWFDPEEDDVECFTELRDCYLQSKGKPLAETILPEYCRRKMAESLIRYVKDHPATEEIREYYARILDLCLERGTQKDIAEYVYAYYGGNELVPCDWRKAEQALLKVYDPVWEPDGAEWAANSLGYIYASNRLGEPDYQKAMKCFAWAAEGGYIEAAYKLSDGYRLGWTGEKDPQKAWEILSRLYKKTNKKKIAYGKYADICLRMGYCYRDGIGVKPDREKALDFFLKAQKGIEARKKAMDYYGDDVVTENIRKAIESVK